MRLFSRARFSARIAAFCAAALCAFAPAPASAQSSRETVYAVSGVRVQASAESSAAARDQAFALGHRIAFERLVARITLPDERAANGMPRIEDAAISRMVASIDVEDERRSGSSYAGRLTVRFQPGAVQSLLRSSGLSVVDQRGPPVLIVPLVTNVPVDAFEAWRAAWDEGGYSTELVQLFAAPADLRGSPSWAEAAPYAQAVGASQAVYLDLRIANGNATATSVEVGSDGSRRDRGSVSARIGTGEDALPVAMRALADQFSERLQNEWKARIASQAGQRARLSATALYSNLAEWQRIKSGLEAAASSTISEIRIEAVARDGALVSFNYVGDRANLSAELRRRGVAMEETQQGPVLRSVRR